MSDVPPVAVNATSPFVAMAPVDVTVPALLTVKPPLAPVLLMPVMLSGFAVLVSSMLPLVLFVALNAPTVFAPFSVWPMPPGR